MFGKIGVPELLVILVIVLVVVGPKQLPKLGETFGKTIKGFRSGMDMDDNGVKQKDDMNEEA